MCLIYEGSIYNYLIVIPLKIERGLAILTLLIISKSIKKNWLFTDKNTICHYHWKSSGIEKDYTWSYFKPQTKVWFSIMV